MSVPAPRSGKHVFPVLTDEEEAAQVKAAMEGDWREDQDLLDDPEFQDPDDLDDDENLEADPEE